MQRVKRRFKSGIFLFCLAVVILSLPPPLISAQPSSAVFPSTPLISMDFKDANLKDILKVFSQQAGLNFIASENIQDRKVTLYLDRVSVQDALNTLMTANNLSYEQARDSKIFIVKEWGRPEVETITKVFALQYARVKGARLKELQLGFEGGEQETAYMAPGPSQLEDAETNIEDVIAKLVTEHGRVISDARTNSLIVTDVPSQFPKIEKTIRELDIKLPQVMIEAEIIETGLDTIDKLGIEWGDSTEGTLGEAAGAARSATFPFTKPSDRIGPGGDASGLYLGYVSAMNLKGALAMLKQDTNSRLLARPRILASNNEIAEIKITADTAIAELQETSSAEGLATQTVSAERVETGIKLQVIPQANKRGEITMSIAPSVINTKASSYFTSYVDPHTRSASTTVTIRDGQTIVIGGLINTDEDKVLRKVPILGDVPILGTFFRKKDDTITNKELVIFITPRIVKENPVESPELAFIGQMSRECGKEDFKKEEIIDKILDEFEE